MIIACHECQEFSDTWLGPLHVWAALMHELLHWVEVANEESKQAHALTATALERERVAKRKFEKAKVAHMISEEKAKKLTIALVVSWVMFVVLLILFSRFGEVEIRQRCLP